jgi:hypothetical protein
MSNSNSISISISISISSSILNSNQAQMQAQVQMQIPFCFVVLYKSLAWAGLRKQLPIKRFIKDKKMNQMIIEE